MTLIIRAAREVESLDHRVRTQFPTPLAYLWREWRVTGREPWDEIACILRMAEGLAAYLASLAIAAARQAGRSFGYARTIALNLSTRRKGTSFGDWLSIVREASEGREFRRLRGSVPFAEVFELASDDVWADAMSFLAADRNNLAHHRKSADETLQPVRTAIETAYERAQFLSEYVLQVIKDTQWNSLRGRGEFSAGVLAGDHPIPAVRTAPTNNPHLERGSLYLEDRGGTLVLLRPLLHYLECPRCHMMSVFYLDSCGDDGVTLKCLERPSTRHEDVAEDFSAVGLVSVPG